MNYTKNTKKQGSQRDMIPRSDGQRNQILRIGGSHGTFCQGCGDDLGGDGLSFAVRSESGLMAGPVLSGQTRGLQESDLGLEECLLVMVITSLAAGLGGLRSHAVCSFVSVAPCLSVCRLLSLCLSVCRG